MKRTQNFAVSFSIASLLFFLGGCAHAPLVPKKGMGKFREGHSPARVIDAHTHVHFTGEQLAETGFVDTPLELQTQLREAKAQGAVALTARSGKEYQQDFSSAHLIPCYGITRNPDLSRLETELRSKRFRCIKIYLGYEAQFPSHPRYQAVYRLAEKYQSVVIFHTGDTLDPGALIKYADPVGIDEVAVEHRKVKFVIAHIGNPWIESAAEVAYKNENVFLDVSALMTGKLEDYSAEDLEEYVIKPIRWTWGYLQNPNKMMFGSDWPHVRIADYAQVVKWAIPEAEWDRFFYLNAKRVFGSIP